MGGDRIPGPFNDAVDEETRQRREQNERHFGGEENEKTIQKALDRAQASWIAEFGRFDEIAVDVFYGHRGRFIRKYADAWLHADAWNKRLMKPVFQALIRKYDLEADPKGTGVLEAEGR